jgi:hypothetical protein
MHANVWTTGRQDLCTHDAVAPIGVGCPLVPAHTQKQQYSFPFRIDCEFNLLLLVREAAMLYL